MDKGDSREGVSNLGTACGKAWQRERGQFCLGELRVAGGQVTMENSVS